MCVRACVRKCYFSNFFFTISNWTHRTHTKKCTTLDLCVQYIPVTYRYICMNVVHKRTRAIWLWKWKKSERAIARGNIGMRMRKERGKIRTRNEFEAIECIFAYTSTSLNRSIYRIQRSCSTYNTVHVVYAIRDMLLLETNTFIFPTTFHFQTDCRFRY